MINPRSDALFCNYFTDPAEQVASVSAPSMHVGLPTQCGISGISNVFHQPVVPSVPSASDLGITNIMDGTDLQHGQVNLIREQECIASNIDNLRKSEILAGSLDSINHFYTHDSLYDDKLQHKPYVGIEAEPSTSLTIHNDISQKLLQKQQNDVLMNQHSYEKKLNQPNIQPSVSNVFNNLNDFLSAPSVSLVNLDSTNESRDTHETRQTENIVDVTDSFLTSFVNSNTDSTEKCSIDDLLTVKTEDLIEDKKEHNAVPPKYQNILLPIKLDPCTPEKSTKSNNDLRHKDLEFPDLITGDDHVANVFNKPERTIKNILDEPEHVYENVYIGTDIPKTQEVYGALNKSRKLDPEIEHTYENVNFGTQGTSSMPHDKDGVYECIYISNRENLPETNTELEIAAKIMADQLNLKESEVQNTCPIVSASTSSCASTSATMNTKLVFQTVQLDNPITQIQEPKPIVGFTTIDDMSEEELNKYLADLEAEERANERALAVYENVPVDITAENLKPKSMPIQRDDEDANEAPIFEAVTIGELPQVPREDLQEKAKKFPVIDYSKGNTGGETSREFHKKVPEANKVSAQVIDDGSKIKKTKKTHEKVRKSSDNTEPTTQNSSQDESRLNKDEDTEKDKENGNYVSTCEKDDNQSKSVSQDLHVEENKNLNCTETTTSTFDSIDNKNLENKEQNVNQVPDDNKLTNSRTPIRNTETISRFSVTRNVDVNDKLGGRSKPSHAYNRSKNTESNADHTESSDDDPNRPSRPQTLDVVSSVNMLDTSSAGIFHKFKNRYLFFIFFIINYYLIIYIFKFILLLIII